MREMLKTLGILSWGACLLTLAYQGVAWVLTSHWPSISLLDILRAVFGMDILSLAGALPVDLAAKIIYVCFTTELPLFLWWTGASLFGLMVLSKTVLKK